MKNQITEEDVLLTTGMLAKVYGVTPRTVQNWTRAGMPKAAPGGYSLRAVLQWMRAGAADDGADVSEMSLAQKKLYYEGRHRAALAELQTMKLETMRGELVPAAQVTDDLRRFCAVLKKEMQGIGRECIEEVAPDMDAARVRDLEDRVERRIEDALRQLSAGEFAHGGD